MLVRLVFCLVCAAMISAAAEPEMEDPYKNVELLPFNPHGWYSNARRIDEIFKAHKIQTVVEIGSWLGCSTRHIATLLPQGGKIYAVDHWLGSSEHVGSEFVPHLYQQFLSNVIHAKLTDRIVPVKMESAKAAEYLKDVKVDLVYIDGSHDTESVLQDLKAWYPFVKGHGVICGDDWTCSTVADAVKIFAKENNLKIFQLRCFWKLEEPKK